MTRSLQIRVYDSLDALEELRPAWERLMGEATTATIFSAWEWLAPWWRAYGGDDELLCLGFFNGPGELVGLAPLALTTRRIPAWPRLRLLRLMGDGSGDSDNLDLPVRPGYEADFAQALLDYLEKKVRWDFAEFNTLPPDSAAGNALREQMGSKRWTQFVYPLAWSVLDLPKTWEEYLKQVSRKERHHIGYNRRRMERQHQIRFYQCAQDSELPGLLQTLYDLHEMRWQLRGQQGTFASQERRKFYAEMAHAFLSRGWLDFWFLDVDGKPAAAQFLFRYRATLYALQMGFDPQYGSLNVQDVLRVRIFENAFADGIRRIDYLAGEDPRKSRFGARLSAYHNLHFARPRTRGSLYLRLLRDAGAGKEWLRARLPGRAWQGLRWLNKKLGGAKPEEQDDQPTDSSEQEP